jgi:hypothetical protein
MKNNNNKKNVSNPFSKGIAILIMLIVTVLQSAFGQISITTSVPDATHLLQVGTVSSPFTVYIKNLGTQPITLNTVTLTPFQGVTVVGNQTVDNKGFNIPISNNVFTIGRQLLAGDSLRFTYNATAGCPATGQTSKVQDDILLSYTLSGQNNTVHVKSDSYPILFPQLTVATKSLEVTLGNSYDLITEVSNATGAGNVDEMQLIVTFPAGTDVVATAPVLVSGSTTVSGMSLPSVINGSSVTYTLNKGVLETMGFTSGSTFYIKQPIKVNSYFDSKQIQYSVSQKINGVVCNAVTSSGLYTLTQAIADPNLAITLDQVIKQVKICDTTGIIRIKIKNSSTHNISGTAIISALSFSLQNMMIDDIRTTTNNPFPFVNPLSSNTSTKIITLDPKQGIDYDGTGGFGDYNNDGLFLDLKAGESAYLDLSYHVTSAVLYSNFPNCSILNQSTYNGIDNSSYVVNNYISIDQFSNSTVSMTGPSDIDVGTNNAFSYTGNTSSYTLLFLTNRQYYLRAIVPSGFTINNQGTELLIPITPNASNIYSASVNVQSTTLSTCGYYPIKWQLIFKEDGCNSNNYSIISTEQQTFFNHTQNGCSSIPNAVLSLDISRKNTGYKGITTSPIFASDLKNYEQYTEANCPNSKLFVGNDTMRVKLKVIVPASGTCAYQTITANISENSSTDYVIPFSATLTVHGNTFITTNFSVSYSNGKAIRNAIFSFPSGLSIVSTDTINIMILSKLSNSTIENTGIELRGSITTVDCNNKSQGSDTRGNTYETTAQYLTYVEHSASVCDGQSENFTLSAAPTVFVDEFRPEYAIKEMTITKYPGLQYNSFSVICNSTLVPTNKYTVTSDNNFVHISFSENLILPGYETDQKIVILSQNGSLCSVSGQSSNTVTTNGKVYYSQRGVSKMINASFNNPNLLTTYVPFYSFTPSSIVSNDGKTITWSLRVTNTGNSPAPYTAMEWAISGGKSSLQLQKVSINNKDVSLSSVGSKYYFMLSTNGTALQPNTSYDLLLTAKYNGCAFNDSIISTLKTAFNCNYFNYSDFNTYVCDSFTQKLKASTYDFSLVPSIPQSPSSFYNFCDSIPYSVEVFLGNTDSSNVSYWINPLPSNIIIKGNKINYEFDGKTGTLDTKNVFTPNNQNISKEILNNYFGTVPNWNQKSVKLSFNLSIECSNQLVTDITKVLSENALRTNICGAEKKETFDFTPKIHGFENLQKIKIDALANGFDANQTGDVKVTTRNIHTLLVDSVNVTAILPLGVTYKSSTNVSEFEKITSSIDVNGVTTVNWAFERGKYIQGKDSVAFNAQFENTNICSTDSAKVIFISSLQRKVLACNKIDSCIATASSDTAIVYLKRKLGNLLSSVDIPTICQGESFSLNPKSVVPNVVYTYAIVPANTVTVNGNSFTPSTTFSGDLSITITGTKDGCHKDSTIIVTVSPKTAIQITSVSPLKIDDNATTLIALPIGGVWSGAGVTGDKFDPAVAGEGFHTVYYTYSKVGFCDSKDSTIIEVKPNCKLSLTVENKKVCNLDNFNLPINISDISACGLCLYNLRFVVEYDANHIQFNSTTLLKNSSDISMYITKSQGKIVIQLYPNTEFMNSFIGGGKLLELNFTPLLQGSSQVQITNAYANGNGLQSDLIGKLTAGTVTVLAPPTISITNPVPTICIGSPATLTASGGESYIWNNNNNQIVQTVSPNTTTDYIVTGTDINGCTNTAITTVYVNALPTIIATASSSTICSGNQTTIGATGANSYVWNPTAGVVNPIITTTYDVTGTDNNGCTSTSSVTVKVNSLPTIVATASLSAICIGSQTTVSAIGGNTYVWSPLGGTVSPTSTTSYNVTGTDNNGCSNSSSVTVTVNNLPNIVAATSLPTICSGNQTIVSASGANSYVWSPSAGTVSPTVTTTYYVTGTDNGCTNTASTTVTVNSLPTIIATASVPTICLGNQTTVSATGANSYVWNPSAGNVNPTVTTTYYVTGTDGNGCKNIANTKVIVNALPTVIATASSPTICLGKQTTVSATGAISYLWNPSAGTISPIATTTYYVTGTDGNGCMSTASTKVTVNTLPTVIASSTIPTICLGKQTTVSATGANTYSWSPLAGNVNPTVTTTYYVTGTDSKGCINTANTKVTVNALPTIIATASIPSICLGSQTVVSATGANSYSWSPLAGTVSPIVTTTYYVTGTSSLGCLNTATTIVKVKPLPTISVITGNITSSVGLTATYSVINQTGVSYAWTVTGGTIQSGQGTNQVSIKFTTIPATISVTALSNGCTSPSASLTVTQSLVTITGLSVDCKTNVGDIDWSSYSVPTKSGSVYTWSISAGADFNTASTATGTTVQVRFLANTGTVTLTVTETTSGLVTGVGTIVISKNIRPTVGVISGAANFGGVCLTEHNVPYSVVGTNASSYVWTVPDGDVITSLVQVQNNITVSFNQITNSNNGAGNIVVFGQNGAGCLSYQGSSLWIGPNGVCPVGKSYVESTNTYNDGTIVEPLIPIITSETSVTVIPQPAKNEVRVVSTSPVKTVTMYDMNGKVVISVKNITVIDITTLSSGTYQMVIETEAGVFNRTVVVIK